MVDVKYKELSSASIGNNRIVVISSREDGSFTVAQKMKVVNDYEEVNFFLKGALHIKDEQGLLNLKEAICKAVESIEKF